ncbi:MAG: ribosome biogenesis GTPase Der [Actinobacteria bacterium]|nr:ribosome biogenesis GTPase Der [Actinomycetota bacterium]
MSRQPIIAIVGRPNVGKSTLVNRIVGRREAIVEQRPGVTRDRKRLEAEWNGVPFTLIDTGGWMTGGNALDDKVSRQAEQAVDEADLALFVVDVTVGITADDEEVAAWLRRRKTPVVVVANKVDGERRDNDIWEFMGLGLDEPIPISALHGRGSGDMLDEILDRAIEAAGGRAADLAIADDEFEFAPSTDDESIMSIALVGRPNVGKSTLFNRLVGAERSIVHDMPGTTRDAIDTVIETDEGPLRFVDTAGMRRKNRMDDGSEYFSMVRSLVAIDRADVAVLLIDATEGITHQDQRLAERVDAGGCAIVVVLNKWELLNAEQRADVSSSVRAKLPFLAYAPILKLSAKTGLGANKLMPALHEAIEAYHRRVPTRELNLVIQGAQAAHPEPGVRILYATQGASDPPTFTLFTNKNVPAPYLRYLERKIREHFKFGPSPLKLRVRRRGA